MQRGGRSADTSYAGTHSALTLEAREEEHEDDERGCRVPGQFDDRQTVDHRDPRRLPGPDRHSRHGTVQSRASTWPVMSRSPRALQFETTIASPSATDQRTAQVSSSGSSRTTPEIDPDQVGVHLRTSPRSGISLHLKGLGRALPSIGLV